jgi:hypothetical protein
MLLLPGKGQQDFLADCLVAVHVGNQLHHGAEQRAWPVQFIMFTSCQENVIFYVRTCFLSFEPQKLN